MKQVKIKKDKLIAILKANRKKHKAQFKEAWDSYQLKAIDRLEELMRSAVEAKRGDNISTYVTLPCPEDHTDDYDRSLQMLELEVSAEVVLTEGDFARLVQDDWDWKQQFSSAYLSNTGKFAN